MSVRAAWLAAVDAHCAAPDPDGPLPSDAQVIGAVQRATGPAAIAMVAAGTIADLEAEVTAARGRDIPTVIVIETRATEGPGFGAAGHWWDVAVPEVSHRPEIAAAYDRYLAQAARVRRAN